MSVTAKIVLGLGIAVLVIGGAYAYMQREAQAPALETSDTTSLPSGTRTDDEALSQDLTSIDTQLEASSQDVNEASASVDAVAQ